MGNTKAYCTGFKRVLSNRLRFVFSRSEIMGKTTQEHQPLYRPMPHSKRYWVYYENCYTEDELNLRELTLKTRLNSGIHPDLLNNPSSWFGEDSVAFININEKAWILSNSYKTRHTPSRDDFHVQPIDSQRLQWPILYDLMQKTGDYLILRNQHLPEAHLNQPMNFVLLDINQMLKSLSQNPNIKQVQEQLDLITKYLRTLEKNISPSIGSDRLFLANFRHTIDKEIHPQLIHQIESQLLKDRLTDMSKTIKKLSIDRNRILHFALNVNAVNPHPYDFSMDLLDDTKAYPTQTAKQCGQHTKGALVNSLAVLELSMEQLMDCPNFSLITTKQEILTQYAKAITDLDELARFQSVISQILNLLGQAGELYTLHQFKQQMLSLLKQMNHFIDESSDPIEAIIEANTQAYHKAIQDEQNLAQWKKWLTTDKIKLKNYIKNQDTLAQFPSNSADLTKTNKEIKEHIHEVITHLSQSKTKTTAKETITGQTDELNTIMQSMHNWITIQSETHNLKLPSSYNPIAYIVEPPPQSLPQTHYKTPALYTPKSCVPSEYYANQTRFTGSPQINYTAMLSLLACLPIVFIALYVLSKWLKEEDSCVYGNQEDFQRLQVKTADVLAEIQGQPNLEGLFDYTRQYEELLNKAEKGLYDVEALHALYEDICYSLNEPEYLTI